MAPVVKSIAGLSVLSKLTNSIRDTQAQRDLKEQAVEHEKQEVKFVHTDTMIRGGIVTNIDSIVGQPTRVTGEAEPDQSSSKSHAASVKPSALTQLLDDGVAALSMFVNSKQLVRNELGSTLASTVGQPLTHDALVNKVFPAVDKGVRDAAIHQFETLPQRQQSLINIFADVTHKLHTQIRKDDTALENGVKAIVDGLVDPLPLESGVEVSLQPSFTLNFPKSGEQRSVANFTVSTSEALAPYIFKKITEGTRAVLKDRQAKYFEETKSQDGTHFEDYFATTLISDPEFMANFIRDVEKQYGGKRSIDALQHFTPASLTHIFSHVQQHKDRMESEMAEQYLPLFMAYFHDKMTAIGSDTARNRRTHEEAQSLLNTSEEVNHKIKTNTDKMLEAVFSDYWGLSSDETTRMQLKQTVKDFVHWAMHEQNEVHMKPIGFALPELENDSTSSWCPLMLKVKEMVTTGVGESSFLETASEMCPTGRRIVEYAKEFNGQRTGSSFLETASEMCPIGQSLVEYAKSFEKQTGSSFLETASEMCPLGQSLVEYAKQINGKV